LQAYTFVPITTMVVSIFWFYFLHPIKAWKKDRLGFILLVASHIIKPTLFVVFGGTSFLRGYLLMTAAYWITSEDSELMALLSCSGSTAKQGRTSRKTPLARHLALQQTLHCRSPARRTRPHCNMIYMA
jgi:hypothetical protein